MRNTAISHDNTFRKGSKLESVEKKEATAQARKQKVLLVEDYPPNVLVAQTLIQQFGYDCDVAGNGAEAIEKVKANPYDMILMDVQMHTMDGLEATKYIREHEFMTKKERRMPIVGMTAHALAGDRDRCLESGMDDYIAKPFDPKDLQEKIKTYINSNQ